MEVREEERGRGKGRKERGVAREEGMRQTREMGEGIQRKGQVQRKAGGRAKLALNASRHPFSSEASGKKQE